MLDLHPNILTKNGKNKFVVLPYKEYRALKELLEDIEDIALIEEARRNDDAGPGLTIEEVRKQLGLDKTIKWRSPRSTVRNTRRRSALRKTTKSA